MRNVIAIHPGDQAEAGRLPTLPGPIAFRMTPRTINALGMLACLMAILAFRPVVGRGDALSSALTPSRVMELGGLACAAGLSLVLLANVSRAALGREAGLIVGAVAAFALWACFSALFSPLPLIGVVKSVELALLLLVAAAVVLATQGSGRSDVVSVVAAAAVTGVALLLLSNFLLYGTLLPIIPSEDADRPRLVLGNSHPLSSAMLLALAILLVLQTRLPMPPKLGLAAAMLALLVLCDARAISVGVVLGALALVMRRIVESVSNVMLSAAVALTALAALVGWMGMRAAGGQLFWDLLPTEMPTLNGRTILWAHIGSLIPETSVIGVGYFNSRVYLLDLFPWAGSTHNSLLEATFTTGPLGLALMLLFIILWLRLLLTTWDRTLWSITPLMTIEGLSNPVWLIPEVPMLALLIALLAAARAKPWSG